MNDDEINRMDVARHLLPPPGDEVAGQLIAEVRSLREAIRRLAEQDATLSVCKGNVTVGMDATLTDAEREAIAGAIDAEHSRGAWKWADTLCGLLERLK